MWSDVANINFVEVAPEVPNMNIKISFLPRYHECLPFDGPGGQLAHAFLPPLGNIHLDEDENWTINSTWGKRVLYISSFEPYHTQIGTATECNSISNYEQNGSPGSYKGEINDFYTLFLSVVRQMMKI